MTDDPISRRIMDGMVQFAQGKTPNECGSCSLCCIAPAITAEGVGDEMPPKAACSNCQHLKPGKGCGVYTERPELCKGFACLWLVGVLGDVKRPDTTGVAWTVEPAAPELHEATGRPVVVIGYTLDSGGAVRDDSHLSVVSALLTSKHIGGVVIRDDLRAYFWSCTGQKQRADINPDDPLKQEILGHTERHSGITLPAPNLSIAQS